jgi:hypothetical protein
VRINMAERYLTKKKKREMVERNDAAVREIYARALPERQEYPPTLRGESKPTVKPFNKGREFARRVRHRQARDLCNNCGVRVGLHSVTRAAECLDLLAA